MTKVENHKSLNSQNVVKIFDKCTYHVSLWTNLQQLL